MALLKEQADLLLGGFYVLEEPNDFQKRYLVGALLSGEGPESRAFGQFRGFDLKESQPLGAPVFTFSKDELISFLGEKALSVERPSLKLNKNHVVEYERTFSEIQNKINETDLSKAVLYTAIEQSIESFPSEDVFLCLGLEALQNKKSGYLFGFYNPQSRRALLGCSPEFIFKTDERGDLITTAVAGTQKTSDHKPWSQKLLSEHKMVMDGVSESLDSKLIWGEVTDFSHGELSHLKAEAIVDKAVETKKLSELLHPTPAIGTLPRKYFNQLDLGPQGRGYFGGYVEILKYEKPFSLVTIRCFEWTASKVQVCIGGGVLKESLAEVEWTELEDKWASFKKLWGFRANT